MKIYSFFLNNVQLLPGKVEMLLTRSLARKCRADVGAFLAWWLMKLISNQTSSGLKRSQPQLAALCICYITGVDENLSKKKSTARGFMTALSFEPCQTRIISLASDTRQATQVFDCTSPHASRFSGIEERGSETAKGRPTGWSRCPSRVLWCAARRLALARSSS